MAVSTADILTEVNVWMQRFIRPGQSVDLSEAERSQLYDIFITDYNRYYPGDVDLLMIQRRAELQGILLYRIARLLFLKGNAACDDVAALGRYLSAFEIYYSAEIGEGFKVNHGMGMVIGARAKVGKNALFHHNVTLGDHKGGRPTLLDHVTMYPGSMALGNITIGNHVIVGANSVCLSDVPDGKTVVGSPAQIIR
jgi:serine O-acetyltransferase